MVALRWAWVWVGLLAIVVCLADVAANYLQLPAQVATHFNAAGVADGWGTRERFVSQLLLFFATIVGVTIVMPVMVWVLPASLINVPDAKYWLAPERIERTREMMLDRVGWLSCATVALMGSIMHILVHANLQAPPKVEGLMTAIVVYFAFFLVWFGEVIWRFGVATKE